MKIVGSAGSNDASSSASGAFDDESAPLDDATARGNMMSNKPTISAVAVRGFGKSWLLDGTRWAQIDGD